MLHSMGALYFWARKNWHTIYALIRKIGYMSTFIFNLYSRFVNISQKKRLLISKFLFYKMISRMKKKLLKLTYCIRASLLLLLLFSKSWFKIITWNQRLARNLILIVYFWFKINKVVLFIHLNFFHQHKLHKTH